MQLLIRAMEAPTVQWLQVVFCCIGFCLLAYLHYVSFHLPFISTVWTAPQGQTSKDIMDHSVCLAEIFLPLTSSYTWYLQYLGPSYLIHILSVTETLAVENRDQGLTSLCCLNSKHYRDNFYSVFCFLNRTVKFVFLGDCTSHGHSFFVISAREISSLLNLFLCVFISHRETVLYR